MTPSASNSESRSEQPWKVYLMLGAFAILSAASIFTTWPSALDGLRPFKLNAFARASLRTQQHSAEMIKPLGASLLDAEASPSEEASLLPPPALPCLQVPPTPDSTLNEEARTDLNGTLPVGFDWQAYLYWHPDLRGKGVASEAAAQQHYMQEGRAQGLMFRRYRTVLVYGGFGGLMNQVYGHIAAILLARAMGAELVMASALHRDTFNAGMSKTPWKAAPPESILDVEAIIEYWQKRGLIIHKAVEHKFWRKQDNTSTMQLEGRPPLDMRSRVKVSTLKRPDFGAALTAIDEAIVQQTEAGLRADPDLIITDLVVHLSNCFWIFPLRDMPEAHEVAQSLLFAPPMIEVANKILRNITDDGGELLNGLHLRLEGDAKAHHLFSDFDGEQGMWEAYVAGMKQALFSENVPLYMASGLLTYGDITAMNASTNQILSGGFASKIFYKELFLDIEVLKGLKSEQSALVDFLVLANCSSFVGFGRSSFSYFLQYYKTLHNYPPAVSVLVGEIPSGMKHFATIP